MKFVDRETASKPGNVSLNYAVVSSTYLKQRAVPNNLSLPKAISD